MAFEDLLDHRCDIYHMVKEEKDMGFAIKQTGFSYPKLRTLRMWSAISM